MSLRNILNNKEQYITNLLNTFDKTWDKFVPAVRKDLISLFRAGNYTDEAIAEVFTNHGFDAMAEEFTSRFSQMARFSKEISKEVGYKFLLTPENIEQFDRLNAVQFDTLLNTRAQIGNDLKRFAIEAELEGRTVANIRNGFEQIFDNMGRRLNTEIYTGIRTSEAAIDKFSFENAGIERYVYMGPVDGKIRGLKSNTLCFATMHDPKQKTGWTMAEIEDSETPYIQRGGWNCRHRWLPFTGGAEVVQDVIVPSDIEFKQINKSLSFSSYQEKKIISEQSRLKKIGFGLDKKMKVFRNYDEVQFLGDANLKTNEISINAGKLQKAEEVNRKHLKDFGWRRTTIRGQNIEDAFRHEYGHFVYDSIPEKISYNGRNFNIKHEIGKIFDISDKKRIASQISEYATQDVQEFFAEVFTEMLSKGYKRGSFDYENFFNQVFEMIKRK